MLRFSELLRGQVEDEIPYYALKDLLRALSSNHPPYPSSSPSAFSQTQTPIPSQSSIPFSTSQLFQCDQFVSDDIDLQPKALFLDSENVNDNPTANIRGISDKDDGFLSDVGRQLQLLLQDVEDAKYLTSQHAHLVGLVVNGAVQYLAEQLQQSGRKQNISFEDAKDYFYGKSEQIGEFLDVLCVENFMHDDVVASVSDVNGVVNCVQVFYSVEFWASSWNDYLSEAKCRPDVHDAPNTSKGLSTRG